MSFLVKPQSVVWRKLLFQVHLWVGVGIGLYVLLIGVTGASLVFREEMEHAMETPRAIEPVTGPPTDLLAVADRMRAAHPDRQLTSIRHANEDSPTIVGYLRKDEKYLKAEAHPVTGEPLSVTGDSDEGFLRWLQRLHFDLLAGRTGRIVNGVGALFLLALCLTGMVIWWPGIKTWKRSLTVDFSRKWKRVNWDLHSATGFWTVAVLAMWAVTGAYFAWPTEFRAMVNWVSPVSLANVAKPNVAMKGKLPHPDARRLLAEAQRLSPGAALLGFSFPIDDKGHIRVYMAREEPKSYDTADYHYFDQFTGEHAGVWRRGVNQSAGDIVMAWIGPLHFGTFGGHGAAKIAVKAVWLFLGLAPAVLMLTGFLMYWNRYLGKKWARLRQPGALEQLPAVVER